MLLRQRPIARVFRILHVRAMDDVIRKQARIHAFLRKLVGGDVGKQQFRRLDSVRDFELLAGSHGRIDEEDAGRALVKNEVPHRAGRVVVPIRPRRV